eukprot:TRINITY_DN39933_c0_g1_i1.p1 TRINITY_DN39933_c0_g1~~TRINITY_DN39933_c0_g1_i1.p1  ORF type:complete len:927 (+),score=173.35 TRINITY_DN39933_c0_g1_i1:112-2781(+)
MASGDEASPSGRGPDCQASAGVVKSPRMAASTHAAHAHASSSRKVQELMRQADLLASRGKHAEALKLVEEAIQLEPSRADLHLGRGQCLISLEKAEEAALAFEEARKLNPTHNLAVQGRAQAAVRQKRWDEAVRLIREALEGDPTSACLRSDLARCLTEQGVQCKIAGNAQPQLFREALEVWESHSPAYFQLGVEFSEAGDPAKAKEMYSKAVQYNRGYVEAWNNLGVTCRLLREPQTALEAFGMALQGNENCRKTRENMAICLLEIGCGFLEKKELKQASEALKRALSYNCRNADIHFNMGVMYAEKEKWQRAKTSYELALQFDPKHATALNNLGVLQRRMGNPEAAVQCFEDALQADPKLAHAGKNLGAVYAMIGRMEESIRLTRIALESSPADAEAHNNLALLYRDQGDVEACLEHLDACLQLDPLNVHACSNRLMTLNYPSEKTREYVFDEHRSFGESLERRLPPMFTSWKCSVAGSRGSDLTRRGPLRIGYLSPDFYSHSVSYFIYSVLKHHDPTFAEVTCYSDVAVEDWKTQQLKGFAHRWRPIFGLSDEVAARLIHDDGIDILVELSGHTGNNRLAMLARKPAPIIVTYIGYPHTTGLSRVDYRISDERVDPPGMPGLTTERLVYLPECFLCYTPPDAAPPTSLRPAQEIYGCVTFGSFNNLAKVSNRTLALFCRVLQALPTARLFLKSKALKCPKVQEKYRKAFASYGIQSERLDLSGLMPQTDSHMQMYSLVDVALDTAPYAGTTTTCEALYMGVPVVTLRGSGIHAQSVGASLLEAVQLGDLVAQSESDYVTIATSLAKNTVRLAALRAGLRTRMLRSPLCDAPRHTARLERLYANMVAEKTSSVADKHGTAAAAADCDEQACSVSDSLPDDPSAAESQ